MPASGEVDRGWAGRRREKVAWAEKKIREEDAKEIKVKEAWSLGDAIVKE